MLKIGDIVRWRADSAIAPRGRTAGILVAKQATDLQNPDGPEAEHSHCTVQWEEPQPLQIGLHVYWLELVHELESYEAMLIHDAYPAYEGRDYNWYLAQRQVAAAPTFYTGQRVFVHYSGSLPNDFAQTFNGREGVVQGLGHLGFRVLLDDDSIVRSWQDHDLRPCIDLLAFTAAMNATPLGWQQWQQGDVLERTSGGAFHYTGAHHERMTLSIGELCLVDRDGATAENVFISTLTGEYMGGVMPEFMTFVRRPQVEAVAEATAEPVEEPVALYQENHDDPDTWREGDILELTQGQVTSEDYTGEDELPIGTLVTFLHGTPGEGCDAWVRHNGVEALCGMDWGALRWIGRADAPVPTVAIAVPAHHTQWLPGDILRRTVNCRDSFIQDEEVAVVEAGNSHVCVRLLSRVDEGMPGRHWSPENFTWLSRPEPVPSTDVRAFQLGDRVRVVNVPGHSRRDGQEPWNGREGVLNRIPNNDYSATYQLARDNGDQEMWQRHSLELVRAVEDPATVLPLDWRVGDTVRRIAATAEMDFGIVGQEYLVCVAMDNASLVGTNAYEGQGLWYIPAEDLMLVRRAELPTVTLTATPAPAAAVTPASRPVGSLPLNTELGARVLINKPGHSLHGLAGSVLNSRGSARYTVHVDGRDSGVAFTAQELLPLLTEPQMPAYRPGTVHSLWLDLEGAGKDDCDAFLAELRACGYNKNKAGNGFGSDAGGPCNNVHGRRVGLLLEGSNAYYYCRSTYNATGSLLRDWNQVLREARVNKGYSPLTAAQSAAPGRTHGLHRLPAHFVVEGIGVRPDAAQTQAWLTGHGFRGFGGPFMLFSGNQCLGTALRGAAEAFQARHQCPWLQSQQDKLLITSLFKTHKAMLSTQAAQQRFAVDVEASGPHLVLAFTAFMASIGYRQEHPAQTSGAYLLLNGGNLHANQAATWQYSDVKNNRSALLNLAEPAKSPGAEGMAGKSGWEKLGERLANRGVALPVLEAEDLDRAPVTGDKVCLVFNDVQDGYPETEPDLRAHTCGQQYTVKALRNGLCQLRETGLLLHPDRLQVLETPRGLQNGDQVQLTQAYGEHLSDGQVLTLMNGVLIAADGASYAVPPGIYQPATYEALTAALLRSHGLTLPCVVRVTNPAFLTHGQEVVLGTAWARNNQELAFWTEVTDEKDAWYCRADFQLVVAPAAPDLFATPWKVLKGATRETTALQVGDTLISLAQLEEALAA